MLVTLTAHSQNHYSPVKLPEVLLLRYWIFCTLSLRGPCLKKKKLIPSLNAKKFKTGFTKNTVQVKEHQLIKVNVRETHKCDVLVKKEKNYNF